MKKAASIEMAKQQILTKAKNPYVGQFTLTPDMDSIYEQAVDALVEEGKVCLFPNNGYCEVEIRH